MMRIALLTTDNREHFMNYSAVVPFFGTAPEALLQGFEFFPDVEVHVISCVRKTMKSPTKLAENIWYHPLLVPKIGWLSTGYQGCIRAVRSKLREIQPDIVHGQGTERDCAISAAFSGFSNVITIHGNMRLVANLHQARPFSYEWIVAQLERLTIPLCGGVVCITNYTRECVKGLARRTWLLPNAVDARFFESVPAEQPTPEILVVGTICRRKNQNAFIRALDSIASKTPINLVFLGGGEDGDPYLAEFRGLISSRPWCRWEGFADRETMRLKFARATLVALPSLEDNCPMAVLEGMASGRPVIASRVGGVPDLITDGENGLLFDPLNPTEMAQAVERVLNCPQDTARMALSGRKSATERFHPRIIAEKHLGIYSEFLNVASERS